MPRYTSVARLLAHRANHALGRPADHGAVAADLDLLDRCVAIEAWRWTCDVAADFGQPAWQDRAADRAARLAQGAGRYADGLLREADRRLRPARGSGLSPAQLALLSCPAQLAVRTIIETTSEPVSVAAATACSAARRTAARPAASSERRNGA